MKKQVINNYYGNVYQCNCCDDTCSSKEISTELSIQFHPSPKHASFFIHLKIKGGFMSKLKKGQYAYVELTGFSNEFANVQPEEGSFKFEPSADNAVPEAVLVEQAPVKTETGEEVPTNERTFKFIGNSDEEIESWKGDIVYDADSGNGVETRRVPVVFSTDNWNVESESVEISSVFNPDGSQA